MTTAAHSPAAVATLLQELGLLEDGVSVAALTVNPISGGNTNRIYRVTCELGEGGGQRDLLLRFFGQGSEAFIDRLQEERIFHAVAAQGLCPKLLASFPDGRVEEFVPAQPLTASQFRSPALSASVARQLHALHSISHVDGLPKPSVAILFAQIRAWATRAVALCGGQYEGWDVAGLVTEVDRLEARLLAVNSPICLCHNDVNHLNVLLRVHEGAADKNEEKSNNGAENGEEAEERENTEESSIVFVDLEYAGWNYRGFDLGNLLCECASDFQSPHPHLLDFTHHYPLTQEQHHLARAYLEGGEDVREEEVERLVFEMSEFALASHLLWGVWGLLQSKLSTIEFDFLGYARQRLNEYFKGMGGSRREGGEVGNEGGK